ncbi:hypothetical protein [Demequina sp. NBRC 110054]|uniref:hypothetical protein n=1 Tax=Demequina sp. NBRC 110054 TaxID=1570343 RepID=UPI000A02294D|nr:hypothetical protein [Demequina sp. NBRC 110054]
MTQLREPFRGFSRQPAATRSDRGVALLDVAAVREARAGKSAASAPTSELPQVSARAASSIAAADTPMDVSVAEPPEVPAAPRPVIDVPALDVPSPMRGGASAPSALSAPAPASGHAPSALSSTAVGPNAPAAAPQAASATALSSAEPVATTQVPAEQPAHDKASAPSTATPHDGSSDDAASASLDNSGSSHDDVPSTGAIAQQAAESTTSPAVATIDPTDQKPVDAAPVQAPTGPVEEVEPQLEAQDEGEAPRDSHAPESAASGSADPEGAESSAPSAAPEDTPTARPASRRARASRLGGASADHGVSAFAEGFEAFAAVTAKTTPPAAPQQPGPTEEAPAASGESGATDQQVAEAEAAAPQQPDAPVDTRPAPETIDVSAIVLDEPVLLHGGEIIRPRTIASAASAPTPTSQATAEKTAEKGDELAKAADPATAGQELMALATHRKASVRAAVAARPDLPATVVIFLSRDHSTDVLAALLRNVRVPASTVRFLADHRDPRIADLAVQRLRNEFR